MDSNTLMMVTNSIGEKWQHIVETMEYLNEQTNQELTNQGIYIGAQFRLSTYTILPIP